MVNHTDRAAQMSSASKVSFSSNKKDMIIYGCVVTVELQGQLEIDIHQEVSVVGDDDLPVTSYGQHSRSYGQA